MILKNKCIKKSLVFSDQSKFSVAALSFDTSNSVKILIPLNQMAQMRKV